LKSIFDPTGVHSRGELVAAVLRRDYLPHAAAGEQVNRAGGSAHPDPVPAACRATPEIR
jgi:hypothetical protein